MAAASSFHEFGTTHDDNGTAVHVDVRIGHESAIGTVHDADRRIRVIKVAGESYLQANDAFWTARVPRAHLAAVLRLVRHKWVQVRPGDTALASVLTFGSWDTVTSSLSKLNGVQFEQGPSDVIRGVDTVSAIAADGTSTLFVRETGSPLPVEVTSGTNVMDFDSWNSPVNVTAPAPDQIVEASRLSSGH